MDDENYSIQELCDRTGLPRRTIHFYTQQGLLPAPTGAGMGAHYSQHHLVRLRLIPVLRKQGMRLQQIREKFRQTSPDELQALQDAVNRQASTGQPGLAPRSFDHYIFPGGLILIVPETLDPTNQQKLQELLIAAGRIFDLESTESFDFEQDFFEGR